MAIWACRGRLPESSDLRHLHRQGYFDAASKQAISAKARAETGHRGRKGRIVTTKRSLGMGG
jgi:hypothetical protein